MDNLSGSLVNLRPLRDEDFEFLAGLRNDMRTQGWNQRLPPCYTPKMVKERVEKDYDKPNRGVWGIETKDGKLVGYINYEETPPRLGATIGVITCVESWGKGHAREAMELILRFLFEERGLQVASLWTLSDRVRMIGLAQKLGFKASARLRESAIVGGKVYDTLVMDMIREEYLSKHSKMAGT
jgi:RimJ/RimL family protein N-acetyltransferase